MQDRTKKERNSSYFAQKAKEYRSRQANILIEKEEENYKLYEELSHQLDTNYSLGENEYKQIQNQLKEYDSVEMSPPVVKSLKRKKISKDQKKSLQERKREFARIQRDKTKQRKQIIEKFNLNCKKIKQQLINSNNWLSNNEQPKKEISLKDQNENQILDLKSQLNNLQEQSIIQNQSKPEYIQRKQQQQYQDQNINSFEDLISIVESSSCSVQGNFSYSSDFEQRVVDIQDQIFGQEIHLDSFQESNLYSNGIYQNDQKYQQKQHELQEQQYFNPYEF